ncbi:MAG: ATP-binding cassette domain-containing protein [Gammaproteobacteria bacterium]|nr:ATP-binding cassette domain-containing protein [Gammaproteobacteria bacterium]
MSLAWQRLKAVRKEITTIRRNIISSSSVIRCKQVSKNVSTEEGLITILEEVNLQVDGAETVAVIGQSGSGKTTLLSMLAGLDIPTTGSIELFHHKLEILSEDERAALRNQYVGFVFQAFHLLPGFTALENVMLPLEINDDKHANEKAALLLKRVGMSHRNNHFPTTLSGGEQQRVAIARAFSTTPPLLLADEPTGNLDSNTGSKIIDLLFELNQEQGTSLILVTHDESLTRRCDTCFRLEQGKLQKI